MSLDELYDAMNHRLPTVDELQDLWLSAADDSELRSAVSDLLSRRPWLCQTPTIAIPQLLKD
jgi:hypothetical protein